MGGMGLGKKGRSLPHSNMSQYSQTSTAEGKGERGRD